MRFETIQSNFRTQSISILLPEAASKAKYVLLGEASHETMGDPPQMKNVPKGNPGSWEAAMHNAGAFDQYLLFTDENREIFRRVIGHRAIGVVYDPRYEHYGNDVPSRLSERYDAFIHLDKTKALTPL